jgi:hypothetical protein
LGGDGVTRFESGGDRAKVGRGKLFARPAAGVTRTPRGAIIVAVKLTSKYPGSRLGGLH